VRGETPEDVLLGADQAHVEPVGIAVQDSPQGALVDKLAELGNGRMVEQDMADHEDSRALLGQRDELLSLADVERQGFFDEHVLAGFEALV